MKIVTLLGIAGAIAATGTAFAADPARITMNADHTQYRIERAVGRYTPPLAHKPGLPAIFSNFATNYADYGLYNASIGGAVSGPVTLHGQSWLAAAFTPSAAATIKEVDVAAGFIFGPKNIVELHIYADAAGVPGTELWARKVTLPPFGECCAVVAVSSKDLPKVTAGTQYWLGITTIMAQGAQVQAAWNLNVLDAVNPGLLAINRGTGWTAFSSVPQVAFGIYGQ